MVSARSENRFDSTFLALIALAKELDLNLVLPGESFGVLAQLFPKRFGELRAVEDANLALRYDVTPSA